MYIHIVIHTWYIYTHNIPIAIGNEPDFQTKPCEFFNDAVQLISLQCQQIPRWWWLASCPLHQLLWCKLKQSDGWVWNAKLSLCPILVLGFLKNAGQQFETTKGGEPCPLRTLWHSWSFDIHMSGKLQTPGTFSNWATVSSVRSRNAWRAFRLQCLELSSQKQVPLASMTGVATCPGQACAPVKRGK